MKRNTIKNKRYNINMPTNLYYKPTFIPARVNFAPFAKALLLQIFLGANQVLKCL